MDFMFPYKIDSFTTVKGPPIISTGDLRVFNQLDLVGFSEFFVKNL